MKNQKQISQETLNSLLEQIKTTPEGTELIEKNGDAFTISDGLDTTSHGSLNFGGVIGWKVRLQMGEDADYLEYECSGTGVVAGGGAFEVEGHFERSPKKIIEIEYINCMLATLGGGEGNVLLILYVPGGQMAAWFLGAGASAGAGVVHGIGGGAASNPPS
ncbi:MAG: hypothetical protein HEP71_26595 [Roseivirga sp.]|nr:hypothetical protein [Roseivirga sp.]